MDVTLWSLFLFQRLDELLADPSCFSCFVEILYPEGCLCVGLCVGRTERIAQASLTVAEPADGFASALKLKCGTPLSAQISMIHAPVEDEQFGFAGLALQRPSCD